MTANISMDEYLERHTKTTATMSALVTITTTTFLVLIILCRRIFCCRYVRHTLCVYLFRCHSPAQRQFSCTRQQSCVSSNHIPGKQSVNRLVILRSNMVRITKFKLLVFQYSLCQSNYLNLASDTCHKLMSTSDNHHSCNSALLYLCFIKKCTLRMKTHACQLQHNLSCHRIR